MTASGAYPRGMGGDLLVVTVRMPHRLAGAWCSGRLSSFPSGECGRPTALWPVTAGSACDSTADRRRSVTSGTAKGPDNPRAARSEPVRGGSGGGIEACVAEWPWD